MPNKINIKLGPSKFVTPAQKDGFKRLVTQENVKDYTFTGFKDVDGFCECHFTVNDASVGNTLEHYFQGIAYSVRHLIDTP